MRVASAMPAFRHCHRVLSPRLDVRRIGAILGTGTSNIAVRHCSSTAHASSPPPSTPDAKDHRAVGTDQDLFTTSVYSPGSPLFLPNGAHILNKLVSFLRAQYNLYGFAEVVTPNIYKKSLWEVSGHWQNYKDDMYEVRGRGATNDAGVEDEAYGLKPMNCPGHCLLFKSGVHSYRELPLRYADFSALHRNEVSGALSGLTRVRRFHQDDAHVFCRPQQIGKEIETQLKFTEAVMRVFGMDEYKLLLSTRPEKDIIGSVDVWDSAEEQLRTTLNKTGKAWEVNEGDGAFYGPKIDMQLRDSDGKYHQLSTIQLDLNLPRRFALEYVTVEGEEDYDPATQGKATPVMIHRAIFGSLERFLALLVEHYQARWPFWLSPRQAIVLTVNQDEQLVRAAEHAQTKMSGRQADTDVDAATLLSPTQPIFRVDMDTSARSLGKKILEAKKMKYNMIFVMGSRNLQDGSVDVDFSGQVAVRGSDAPQTLLDGAKQLDDDQNRESRRTDDATANAPAKMKMKVDDVYDWFKQLERRFQ